MSATWGKQMTTYRSRCAVAVATLALAAACTADKQEGPPPTTTMPAPSTTAPTGTSLPTAPSVTRPLDAVDYARDPCTSLTTAQRQTLGITEASPGDIAIEGAECYFSGSSIETIAVVFASNVDSGLSSRYYEHTTGTWAYWQPSELDGYPALAFGTSDPLDCNVAVALTDTLYFWTSADARTPSERCVTARSAASSVLATIRAAN
jgi:hypothetical protein